MLTRVRTKALALDQLQDAARLMRRVGVRQHAGQPAEGRFDGENPNFGAVTIDDEVHA
jgi:hypothetical protein